MKKKKPETFQVIWRNYTIQNIPFNDITMDKTFSGSDLVLSKCILCDSGLNTIRRRQVWIIFFMFLPFLRILERCFIFYLVGWNFMLNIWFAITIM